MNSIGCSTCMESFTSKCDVSTTPCAHVFHTNCITQWLGTGQKNCPECRKYCTLEGIRKLYFSEVDQSDLVNELLQENEKLRGALEKKNSTFGSVSKPKHPFGPKPSVDTGGDSNTFIDAVFTSLPEPTQSSNFASNTQHSTFQYGSTSGSNTHDHFGVRPGMLSLVDEDLLLTRDQEISMPSSTGTITFYIIFEISFCAG